MKAFTPKGWRRPILTSDNPQLKSWRQLVADGADRALRELAPGDRRLLSGAVRLSIVFYLPRPLSLPKRRPSPHITKPDLDKLVRACCDSLTQVVFRDDSQVCELVTAKLYARVGAIPCADIRVETTSGVEMLEVPPAPLPLFEAR